LLTFAFLVTVAAQTFAGVSLDQIITYLIKRDAMSNASFLRSGVSHTADKAVQHVQAKYEPLQSQIKTPEDFIRLAASNSLLTGQPYLVRTPDGKEMHLDAWLTEALKAHQAQTGQ